MSRSVTGLSGLAVLAVLLQSTGGFRVELLGADLVLAVGGYLATRGLLDAARSHPAGRMPLRAVYGSQFKQRVPLLLFTLIVTLLLATLVTPPAQARRLGMAAIAGLAFAGNWFDLVARDELTGSSGDWYIDRPGQIDPLGGLWLLGLLGQFAVLWPVSLAVVWWLARRICGWRPLAGAAGQPAHAVRTPRGGRNHLETNGLGITEVGRTRAVRTAIVTALLCLLLAGAACLVGPARAEAGAELAELALGSHVRIAEWLLGAAAAAFVAAGSSTGPAGQVRGHPGAGRRLVTTVVEVIALAAVLASGLLAVERPVDWLRGGGPALAAGGTSLLLMAVDRPVPSRRGLIGRLLARGGPVELGRMAYPLLVLHLPVFWALGHAVPDVRPYALLFVGGGLAWIIGLLLQDGVVRRLWSRRWRVGRAAPAFLLACAVVVAGGIWLPDAVLQRLNHGEGPAVLVLGGSFAGDLAVTLGGHGSGRYRAVDGSLPECGLYPVAPPAASVAHITADAQVRETVPARAEACAHWDARWRSRIAESDPAVLLVDLSADAAARPHRGTVISPCDVEYRRVYRERLVQAAAVWAEAASGRPVLLTNSRTATGETDPESSRCYNALIVETVARYPQVLLLDVEAALCHAGECWARTASGEPMYSDAVHLSSAGMGHLASWLEEAVDRARSVGSPA